MFNRAIAKQTPPKYLSSDNDPLFRFHRWRANLRILEVDEIKTIPFVPPSHPFVERLIGTVRREYLDRTLFWNRGDLERKLDNYQAAVLRFSLVKSRIRDPVPTTYLRVFAPASASRKIPIICSSLNRLPFICPSPFSHGLYL
jgi:hypothetical protein